MSVLSVLVKDDPVVRQFFKGLSFRLKEKDFYKNPFRGGMKEFVREGERLVVIEMRPVYPEIWVAGFLFLLIGLYLGWWVLIIIGILLSFLLVLWSASFYYIMLFFGLRKAGFKGSVRRVGSSKALRWIVGADRSL